MPEPVPSAAILIRLHGETAYYEAKFRYRSRQIKRRIGPAWLEFDPGSDQWVPRRGRIKEGFYDERRAHVAAAEIVRRYLADERDQERMRHERRIQRVGFREVATAYLQRLAEIKGARPATLIDYRYMLAEPGVPKKTWHGHLSRAHHGRPRRPSSGPDQHPGDRGPLGTYQQHRRVGAHGQQAP